MATVTHVTTIDHVAKMLGEDPELLEATVYNDDNMTYGNILSVYTGTDEALTALTPYRRLHANACRATDDGIEELQDMLAAARRTTKDCHDFPSDFVADPDIIARVKDQPPR